MEIIVKVWSKQLHTAEHLDAQTSATHYDCIMRQSEVQENTGATMLVCNFAECGLIFKILSPKTAQ